MNTGEQAFDLAAPRTVLIGALGGEGGGVLAEWLYAAAVGAGHPAQSTSVPGVAQRTGATTYYVEIGPRPLAALGGARPVFNLSPVPGGVDLLVSSELLEAVRQAGAGLVSPDRTGVIASTARVLTVAEKMALGDGRADEARLAAVLAAQARWAEFMDLGALAREADTAISAVLLGAVAASGVLPLPRSAYESAISAAGKGVKASLRGFTLAFETLQARRAARAQALRPQLPTAQATHGTESVRANAQAQAQPHTQAQPARELPRGEALLALAHARLLDYQDAAYVRLFDERLARVRAAASAAAGDSRVVDETARWLVLWMCFDDVVQVARLKLDPARLARVRREVGARDDQIVKVFDHFKPGVPELAGLLPPRWAARARAWDGRRIAAGREPFALALRLGTHGLRGALAMRAMAAMKPLRRRGERYVQEQAAIERWLDAVVRGASESGSLGLALAQCGRLIKGYGSTHQRGRDNLDHILSVLAFAPGRDAAARAQAVQAACRAALADDAGLALDATLRSEGVAVRPLREQPVRWYRRRPDSA